MKKLPAEIPGDEKAVDMKSVDEMFVDKMSIYLMYLGYFTTDNMPCR